METIYLYAKRHRITGKRYFGKTTQDPYKYIGSGLHWKRHLKKHGYEIETTWVMAYTDQDTLTREALFFSQVYDIVNSNEWLNQKPENGLDGWPKGVPNPRTVPQSAETRAKKSAKLKGTTKAAHFGEKNGRYGVIITPEQQTKMQAGRKNLSWSKERRAKVAATWERKRQERENSPV